MGKQSWKPGNMLYPVPAVLVSCRDKEGNDNVLTIAWAGTICSDPAMVSISVRKERHSYPMIKESGVFVIHLTKGEAEKINAPIIMESPVNIECKVKQVLELGSHDMFIAEVVNVQVSDEYMDEKGAFHMNDADLLKDAAMAADLVEKGKLSVTGEEKQTLSDIQCNSINI